MDINDTNTFYTTGFLLNYDISPTILNYEISEISEKSEKSELDKEILIKKLLDLIDSCITYPSDILINKFFEYARWINIDENKLATIILIKNNENIKNDKCLDELLIETKNNIKQYFDFINLKQINFKKYSHNDILKSYSNLVKKKIINTDGTGIKHVGQPLPDPDFGRPKLSWCKCAYFNCNMGFLTSSDLVCHLVKNNVYTKGYHLSHEESIKLTNLNVEKVIKNNITKCPSWLCETKDFNSPHDLIKHLQRLGIEPFWYKGLILKNDNYESIIFDNQHKIFKNNYCVMCLSNPAEIVINRCGHQVYCIECMCSSNKNMIIMCNETNSNCPICRGKVDCYYPYA